MSNTGVPGEHKKWPSSDSESAPVEAHRRRQIRRCLGALGLGVVLGVNALNSVGDVVQNDKPPVINTYNSASSSKDVLVAFSGLGGYGSDLYCTLNAIDPRDIWGVFHNGQFDLNLESQMIIEKAKQADVKELTLLGDSAGGLMALSVAAEITKSSPVKVSQVHLVTTPISVNNIRPKERLALEASGIALLGGLTTRLMGESAVEINKDYAEGWINSLKSVWDRSAQMPSHVLQQQQELVKQGASIEDIITLVAGGTKIIYFAPNQADQDELLDTDLAYNELKVMVLSGMKQQGVDPELLDNYLSLARLGNKHSMIALSEPELVHDGVWTRYTNASRANYPHEIKQLVGTDDDCNNSYKDVVAALGIT